MPLSASTGPFLEDAKTYEQRGIKGVMMPKWKLITSITV
jgi:hypothetical protein